MTGTKQKHTHAEDEEDHDIGDEGDWETDEDVSTSGHTDGNMSIEHTEVIKIAEQNNKLLHALMSHPQLNRSNPAASPKPLFFAADFVRRTYLEYILPLLPVEAVYRSPKIANKYVFGYPPSRPCPEPAQDGSTDDPWLMDLNNWPTNRSSGQYQELFSDAIGRTMLICLAISDPVKGPSIMGGRFDWERPVNLREMAERIKDDQA